MTDKELMQLAEQERSKAYAPYSNFFVGAALQTKSGNIYTGVNIENAAYGATICAERVAIFKAVHAGEQDFDAIAVCGSVNPCLPCGSCRQVMREFCQPDFRIITATEQGLQCAALEELLPQSFTLRNKPCE